MSSGEWSNVFVVLWRSVHTEIWAGSFGNLGRCASFTEFDCLCHVSAIDPGIVGLSQITSYVPIVSFIPFVVMSFADLRAVSGSAQNYW
jgi:hypothetical protein